jgi:anthraniloyl-CoA monooxygenase
MRAVAVVGGGPAGLLFACELADRRPDLAIDVLDPCNAVSGAGVVLEEGFVREFAAAFPPLTAMRRWNSLVVRSGDQEIWSGGHDIVGVGRRALVGQLRTRASASRNVRLVKAPLVTRPPAGYDLVVGADGAGSRVRRCGDFGTRITKGRTVYRWAGVPTDLPPMFALIPMRHGLLIVHAYPHGEAASTLVLEADPQVLAGEGLLDAEPSETEQRLTTLLADVVGGSPVTCHTSTWQAFSTIRNRRWWDGPIVLIGDAAHTVHFSAGAGTTLAMADARALARAVAEGELGRYESERRPVVDALQADGEASQEWFESLARQRTAGGPRFVFALRTRREANTFEALRRRDPSFVAQVLEDLVRDSGHPVPERPTQAPLALGALLLAGRILHIQGSGIKPAGPPALRLTVHGSRLRGPGIDVCALPGHAALVSGVVVTDPADADRLPPGTCFTAVPDAPGATRVARTARAADIRGRSGLPVLLLSSGAMTLDEVDTLVASGRIDLQVACPAPVLQSLGCRDNAESL